MFSNPHTPPLLKCVLTAAAGVFLQMAAVVWAAEAPRDYIQRFPAGEVNWSTGKITATGFSKPAQKKEANEIVQNETLSAARKKAVDSLAEIIGGLRLWGERTVSARMEADPAVAEKVHEMVHQAPVVRQSYLSDGAAEIVIEMGIYGGGFAQLILPEDIRHIKAIEPVNVIKGDSGGAVQSARQLRQAGGLVIDARGLSVSPAMMFAILDENGKQVYGSAYVSRESAVQWGMAAYVRRIPAGRDFARVAPEPLVIRGLRAVGVGRTDIVISNADAIRLKGSVDNLIRLRQGRVVVVLD